LYLGLFTDGTGVSFDPDVALQLISKVANRPIVVDTETFVDIGGTGGLVINLSRIGQEAARLAWRIIKGTDVSRISITNGDFLRPIFDWRQLQRFGIDESRLPAGSEVRFRPPSAWEQYRWQIILIAAAFIAQTSLLAYGLIQYRRRRGAERSLVESEARMTFTAASANIGLWQFNREANELWTTEHCRAMFGLTGDAPLTRDTLLAAIHPEDRDIAIGLLRKARNSSQSAVSDVRVVLPDDQLRWVRIRARSHSDDLEAANQLSGIFVDITEQKAAEADAALRRQEVTHLMRVSVVGELSGAIAHEVNQPLTAILSNAQAALYLLTQDSPNLAEVRDALQDIVSEDNRAGEVIHRLRGLLKKDQSKSERVDVNDLVNSTIAILRSERRSKSTVAG
jgi:PAS domain S-box-containing protein